ncbi:hypothetical protein HEP87_60360 [Streptomyces sp. S1D4-11]
MFGELLAVVVGLPCHLGRVDVGGQGADLAGRGEVDDLVEEVQDRDGPGDAGLVGEGVRVDAEGRPVGQHGVGQLGPVEGVAASARPR